MTCDGQSFLCAISCELALQWFDSVQAGVAKKNTMDQDNGNNKVILSNFR